MAIAETKTEPTPAPAIAGLGVGVEPPTVEPEVTQPMPDADLGTSVDIVLRAGRKVGDGFCEAGSRIATVQLEPDVSLNFMVDAVRNGLAGEKR